jgi:pimeloyl-ACP methyl ester carboxylesterase
LITIRLAVQNPDDLVGIHLNAATVLSARGITISEEEQSWRREADAFSQRESDYAAEQRNQPETVDTGGGTRAKINVPTGYAAFPREMTNLAPPRSALERSFNLVHYTKMPKGGHFAAFEQPTLFVADVREFFRKVRT